VAAAVALSGNLRLVSRICGRNDSEANSWVHL
jgi:hypothetical protein